MDDLLIQVLNLQKAGRRQESVALARTLTEKEFGVAQDYAVLAGLLAGYGNFEAANCLYEKAISRDPRRPDYHYNQATVLRFLGNAEAAESACDRALAIHPGDAGAHYLRSGLRRQTEVRNHIETLNAASGAADSAEARSLIAYALAKEYEDLGQFDRAFAAMKAAGDARRSVISYDIATDERILDAIGRAFGPAQIATAPGRDSPDAPVFVVGLPRTGTTLVDRILTRTGDIASAGERPDFALELTRLIYELVPGARLEPLDMVARSAKVDFAALGRRYVDRVRRETGLQGRFLDKLPLNFLYVGLIARALPQAKIVHVVRDPMDTCLAIYKQSFERLYPFSYRMEETARYFIAYHRLMAQWDILLPGKLLTVSYEDLVADPETASRRLCEFCGIAWTPSTLDLAGHPGAVTTASAIQARRPIYADSVGLWRRYEPHLAVFHHALEQAGIGWGQRT